MASELRFPSPWELKGDQQEDGRTGEAVALPALQWAEPWPRSVRRWRGGGGRALSWADAPVGRRSRGRGQGPEVAGGSYPSRTGVPDAAPRGLGGGSLDSVPANSHPSPSRRRSLSGRWWPACCCCAPGPGALQLARDPCVGPLAQARGPASTCSAASCPLCTSRTACPGEPGLPVPAPRWGRPQPSHQSLMTLGLNPLPTPKLLPGTLSQPEIWKACHFETLLAQEPQNVRIRY